LTSEPGVDAPGRTLKAKDVGLIACLAAISAWLPFNATAQWVVPDPDFPAGTGPDFIVRTAALQDDGKLLIGGLFTNVDGLSRPGFARVDTNGAVDVSFVPQVSGEPTHIEVLSDRRILISGSFTNVSGIPRPGLAVLEADGTLDPGFVPTNQAGSTSPLTALLAPGGAVMVSGTFTNLGGIPANHLARLLANGSVDPLFISPFDRTNTIILQAIQSDGKPIISGSFSNIVGMNVTNLTRLNLDGSIDLTFVSGLFPDEGVRKVWLQADGRLLVLAQKGAFLPFFSRLARLNTNGTIDASFNVSMNFPGFPWNATLSSVCVQADGRILLGGTFMQVDGFPRARVARLEPDGTLDYCFDIPFSADLSVFALVSKPDESVLVAGSFGGLQGQLHPFLMRLLPPNGCAPGIIQLGISNALARADSPGVMIPVVRAGGGDREETVDFYTRDGSATNGQDYVAGSGTVRFAPGQRSQSITVPLVYTGAGNGPVSFELILTNPGGGASLGPQTNVIVTLSAGMPGTAGMADTNFIPHLDGPVQCILPLPAGGVVIAGTFTNVGGQLSPNVARLKPDGTPDPSFVRSVPLDGEVVSAAVDAAGRVLVAGYFQHVDGQWRPALARFNADGSLDNQFGPFDSSTNAQGSAAAMRTVAVLPDGGIVCGGYLNYYSSDILWKFSSLGQLDAVFTNHLPPFLTVTGVTPLSGGDFLVTGSGFGSSIVRLHADGALNQNFIPPADRQFMDFTGRAVGIAADQRMTVAGGASAFSGLPNQPPFWRLNPDGSLDTGFSATASFKAFGPLTFVQAFGTDPDGRVLVAGSFSNGPPVSIARFNSDGSPDYSFDSGRGLTSTAASSVSVNAIAALPQGGWLIGGDFASYDGFTQPYLVKVLPETPTPSSQFQFELTNLTVWETNGPLTLEVTRTGDASSAASVRVTTQDGTAVAGQDFASVDQILTFAPGEWSKIVSVQIIDDLVVEPLEQFTVQLSQPTGAYTIGTAGSVSVQIRDDDTGVEFVSGSFNAIEESGFALVGVHWTGLISNGLSVIAKVTPITGRSSDLGLSTATITFNGPTTNWFRIPIVDDQVPEGLRQYALELIGTPHLIPGPQSNSVLSVTDRDFPSFAARGVAGSVETVANASNGGVYVAGDFTGVNGVPFTRVARLTPDGEVDLTFNPGVGPDSNVTAIAEQPDGKLVIGGSFTAVNGIPRAGLARLNHDGSLDSSFNAGSGISSTNGIAFVRRLLPLGDGRLWVAGAFTHLNGKSSQLLARLNNDGSLDLSFSSPFSAGIAPVHGSVLSPSVLYDLSPQPDGKLLASGLMYFGSGISLTQANLARLTSAGQPDISFTRTLLRFGFPRILAVAYASPDKFYAGSTISSMGLSETNWVALDRLDTNGGVDPSFQLRGAPVLPFGIAEIRQILVQPDGKILFSAAFYGAGTPLPLQYRYLPAQAVLGRLLPDGTWDNSFSLVVCDLSEATALPGPFWFSDLSFFQRTPSLVVPAVSFAQQPNGVLVLGGIFGSVNGQPRRRLARIDTDGTVRGQLRLALIGGSPGFVVLPPEIETPYVVEASSDLREWTSWVESQYPWWPLQLPIPEGAPVRFFRARALQPPGIP
jgi:large repetitive protein